MKNTFIKDLENATTLTNEEFVLKSLILGTTKTGKEYARVVFGDKTGDVNGNMWQETLDSIDKKLLKEGQVYQISGRVETFKDALQINISSISPSKDYSDEDFIPVSRRHLDEMWEELMFYVDSIENKDIKDLLKKIFKNEKLANAYRVFPAAEKVHHAYKGGLMEHVLEMLEMSDSILKNYPEADASIVRAGIILHDIGKIYELANNSMSYSRSRIGNLVGHIVIGTEMFTHLSGKDFPKELGLQIKHIILSHHGILEYGSPVVPMTIEAIIVNQLDETSSKIRQYQRILQENEANEDEFSKRDFILGTKVLLN